MHISGKLVDVGFIVILSLLTSGCFSSGQSKNAKLSDVMKSSAANDQRDVGSGSPRKSGSDSGFSIGFTEGSSSSGSKSTVATTDAKPSDYKDTDKLDLDYYWQVPVDVTYSVPFSGDIKWITHFTVSPVAAEGEHSFLGLYVGGADVEFKSESLADKSLDDPWMLETGLAYRYYLNHNRTAISPYLAGRFGAQVMFFDYRNPVNYDGRLIRSDWLGSFDLYAGFGVSTIRNARLSFFGEIGVGGNAFWNETYEGFENDVFGNYWFFSIKAGLSLKFL